VPIADPGETAAAILDLLTDREAWESARAVGIRRVDEHYSEQLMLERYEHLYAEAADQRARPVAAAGE
jgi:glycosyltransferase involved in cell wall biosynthesis